MGIPKNASFIQVVVNQNEIAVYNYGGIVRVEECYHDEVGEVVEQWNGAHLYLEPDEARKLSDAILTAATVEEPISSDYLIQNALEDALEALEDVRLICLTPVEANIRRNEIESIMVALAERCRRVASKTEALQDELDAMREAIAQGVYGETEARYD